MGKATAARELLTVDGHEVVISNPGKVLFPEAGYTKLDLVRYYLAVADGALRGSGDRPNMLVRYPDGIEADFFYQKRAPNARPSWIDVVIFAFPSGRSADEVVPRHAADLAWMANLACLELHPHPVRADDLDHPDELRIDLDPVDGVAWPPVRDVARVVQRVLGELGLVGWPKTSGKRGMHVLVRIEPRWTFDDVRRAALALAREVERRVPDAGHEQVVEGRAPRRLHRLQPERQGPHRRRRVLDPADARRARVGAPRLERGARLRARRTSPCERCRRASSASATGTPESTTSRARSPACSSCRHATNATARATRRGRRTTPKRRVSRGARRRRGAGPRSSR